VLRCRRAPSGSERTHTLSFSCPPPSGAAPSRALQALKAEKDAIDKKCAQAREALVACKRKEDESEAAKQQKINELVERGAPSLTAHACTWQWHPCLCGCFKGKHAFLQIKR